MKRSMPYYFKEGGWTIKLTAEQYKSLRAGFEARANAGDAEARRRLSGFGPAPQA